MSQVEMIIDGKTVTAAAGRPILWAALDAGIFIPHLCALRANDEQRARCRLCWVEMEGEREPLLACTVAARAGLVVRTSSPAVDGLVRSAFELIMSHHRLDCVRCPANRRCALQEIARRRRLPLRPKGLTLTLPEGALDESRPELGLDPTKCVLCALCVWVCNHEVKKGIIDCIGRGLSARVGTFDGRPLASQGCGECVRCAEVCPVGAIYLRQQV